MIGCRRHPISRRGLGGFLEFDFGGVAEGVEDAEQEVGGNIFGVAIHDGGDARAGSACQSSDLRMGQALALNDFDDLGVEIAA